MQLTGRQLIGSEFIALGTDTFRACNPATGEALSPVFHEGCAEEIERALRLAEEHFDIYRMQDNRQRSLFLETIADQLLSLAAPLIERAHLETALPLGRLEGELARTVGQIRMFARLVVEGCWADARIDHALADRQPVPRPDLRSRQIPLGPVAVFGAGNFPLAFSVAGGDTISALAAGCCVIAKGHPAHPGTSEIAGRAILGAIGACGLPEGVFSLIHGRKEDVGKALVAHPLLKAVAFTGSLGGGRALFNLAAARAEPIPVFAEMGSINPVFLMPDALDDLACELGRNFAEALTLGVGQFCTNPGLVIAVRSPGLDNFITSALETLGGKSPGIMLTRNIKQNYLNRLAALGSQPGIKSLGPIENPDAGECSIRPVLLKVDAESWLENAELAQEVFGPAAIIVETASEAQLLAVARHLKGQLTATIHAVDEQISRSAELVSILERRVGRIILNGFPTGVEVCDAMFHGGPYPATTDSRASSVGTSALQRFLRPVCYQNFPASLLPAELQDVNPSGLWRRVDGMLSRNDA